MTLKRKKEITSVLITREATTIYYADAIVDDAITPQDAQFDDEGVEISPAISNVVQSEKTSMTYAKKDKSQELKDADAFVKMHKVKNGA